MQFASFTHHGTPSWGAVVDNRVTDLGPSGANIASSIREALHHDRLPTQLPVGARMIDLSDLELLPVVTDPAKIICAGVNYHAHREEAGKPVAEHPAVFTRFADTQIGHAQPALRPPGSRFDYEGELAVVIGRHAHQIAPAEAAGIIAGYSCYNDFTARDWQKHSTQWTAGKNFPGTGAFGPFMVTADDAGNLEEAILTTRVNGEVRQQAAISQMVFPINDLLSYISGFTPLAPGDVILTGTPGGVGNFMSPPQFLRDGDKVEVEVTGIGVLHNVVTGQA